VNGRHGTALGRVDRKINLTDTVRKKMIGGEYNYPKKSHACLGGSRKFEITYIEKVISRPSQASSTHHPRPGLLFPSEKISMRWRPSQATPPLFFARAGSAANSSSFPCETRPKYQHQTTCAEGFDLHQPKLAGEGPKEREGASWNVPCFLVARRRARLRWPAAEHEHAQGELSHK